MKTISKILCLSALTFVAACAPAGYYDANGEYRSYGASDSFRHDKAQTPPVASVRDEDGMVTSTTVTYGRAGYYDRNGYYISPNNGPHLADDYMPPRGMCRIWFPDRAPSYQPAVESCNGIQYRVPVGAYVIYGGM